MEQTLTQLHNKWTNATHPDAVSKEIMDLLREVHS